MFIECWLPHWNKLPPQERAIKSMGEFEDEKLYEVCSICRLFNECLMQDRCLSICPYGAYILAGGDWQPTNQIICQVVISVMEENRTGKKEWGMLGVGWGCRLSDIESTHLIAMFPCSSLSKPPHYLQHKDYTSKTDILHPAWFDRWWTLHSQLLQCLHEHSSFGPYLVTQNTRFWHAVSCV